MFAASQTAVVTATADRQQPGQEQRQERTLETTEQRQARTLASSTLSSMPVLDEKLSQACVQVEHQYEHGPVQMEITRSANAQKNSMPLGGISHDTAATPPQAVIIARALAHLPESACSRAQGSASAGTCAIAHACASARAYRGFSASVDNSAGRRKLRTPALPITTPQPRRHEQSLSRKQILPITLSNRLVNRSSDTPNKEAGTVSFKTTNPAMEDGGSGTAPKASL